VFLSGFSKFLLDNGPSTGETEAIQGLEALLMSFCRWTAAVAALALIAGTAVAQVTETKPEAKPAVTAEQTATQTATQDPAPTVQVSPVPEPGSIALITAAAAATGGWVTYWRRRWRVTPSSDTPTTHS
jgi:hypothetical protein